MKKVTLLLVFFAILITSGTWIFYPRDWEKASLLEVKEASEKGNVDAQLNLGMRYVNGEGVEQSNSQAIEWLSKAAENGNVSAQFNLGAMYDKIDNKDQAIAWYTKAAKQGSAIAKYNLGRLYFTQIDYSLSIYQSTVKYMLMYPKERLPASNIVDAMTRNYQKAAEWFRQAAAQGHAKAETDLGWIYYNGLGVKQDRNEALSWFMKGAEHGDVIAQDTLGVMYLKGGDLVDKDLSKAKYFLQKAAEQGSYNSQYYLGVLFFNSVSDDSEAFKQAYAWSVAAQENAKKYMDSNNQREMFESRDVYYRADVISKNVSGRMLDSDMVEAKLLADKYIKAYVQ